MFQEIEPYTYCNDFAWVNPENTDRVLVYRGTKVLVATDSEGYLHFPSYRLCKEQGLLASISPHPISEGVDPSNKLTDSSASNGISAPYRLRKADGTYPEAVFLFTVGNTAYFRCMWDEAQAALVENVLMRFNTNRPASATCTPMELTDRSHANTDSACLTWQFMPISELHHHAPRHRAFAGLVGYTYHTWYDTRRFCGRCGAPLVHDEVERMMRCPQCGVMEFPKLFPAVIIGIVDTQRDRVLVSRYANREYKRYALIAGFSEMGETVEQTVHREVMEEVGLHVKTLRYYKSQPWPPSSSLLFGFFCELDGDRNITLDEHELEHAEWIPREALPQEDADYSLTRDMMQVLRKRQENHYPISG